VHGGPEGQICAVFNPIIQYFAHRGFTVIAPNVRAALATVGKYLRLDDVEEADGRRARPGGWRGLGGDDWPRPFQKRIAVMGGSYGGSWVAALTYQSRALGRRC